MPVITISRRREWIFWNRRVELYLDGKSMGCIEQRVKRNFELSPGEHHLKLKLPWYQRREHHFTLLNKETKSFVIQTNYKALLIYEVMFVLLTWLINNRSRTHVNDFKALIIGLIIAGVWGILFGRTHFITLKEGM